MVNEFVEWLFTHAIWAVTVAGIGVGFILIVALADKIYRKYRKRFKGKSSTRR